MKGKPFSFRLENGGHVIRDHTGQEIAKVGTKAQVSAILKQKLGLKEDDKLDLSEYEGEPLQSIGGDGKPQDGAFMKGEKWYYRALGKVYPKKESEAFQTREEAQQAYHDHE